MLGAEGWAGAGGYIVASTALGASTVDLTYSPSTTNVAKASLQVYVTGNSGVLGYVEEVGWWGG